MEEELPMPKQLTGLLPELLHNRSPPPSDSNSSFLVLRQPQLCCDIAMPSAKRSRKERNQGEGDETNGDMDPEIWQDFPQELYEAVVSRLPIATFFQFRVVCREWNAFIDSHIFSRCFAHLPQTMPWFYTLTQDNINPEHIYDPSLKKWHNRIISGLPTKNRGFPMASAGGLVCFLDVAHRYYYVRNPLTKSFRKFRASLCYARCHAGLGMVLSGNSTSHGYKILWVGWKREYEVYDSVENAWTRQGTIPSDIKLPAALHIKPPSVPIHNTLYLMLSDNEGILSYDMVSGEWKQWIIPNPPYLSDNYALAVCGDRLMLVGLLNKVAETCVCIWELQKMKMLWKEVDKMPNVWGLEYIGKHIKMNCLGSKGCLILLSLRSRRIIECLITYNVVTREWTQAPSCTMPQVPDCSVPPPPRIKRPWLSYGIAFHPNPTAKA